VTGRNKFDFIPHRSRPQRPSDFATHPTARPARSQPSSRTWPGPDTQHRAPAVPSPPSAGPGCPRRL